MRSRIPLTFLGRTPESPEALTAEEHEELLREWSKFQKFKQEEGRIQEQLATDVAAGVQRKVAAMGLPPRTPEQLSVLRAWTSSVTAADPSLDAAELVRNSFLRLNVSRRRPLRECVLGIPCTVDGAEVAAGTPFLNPWPLVR